MWLKDKQNSLSLGNNDKSNNDHKEFLFAVIMWGKKWNKTVWVCVCIFCSKSWNVFKRNADRVIDSIRGEFPDIEVEVNPKKPRSKTFEVGLPAEFSDKFVKYLERQSME